MIKFCKIMRITKQPHAWDVGPFLFNSCLLLGKFIATQGCGDESPPTF